MNIHGNFRLEGEILISEYTNREGVKIRNIMPVSELKLTTAVKEDVNYCKSEGGVWWNFGVKISQRCLNNNTHLSSRKFVLFPMNDLEHVRSVWHGIKRIKDLQSVEHSKLYKSTACGLTVPFT